jgi:membrane protease YdiL (CAAX protease family)
VNSALPTRCVAALAALFVAVLIRVQFAGAAGARSAAAGLLFGALTAALAGALGAPGSRRRFRPGAVGVGLVGAAVLCLPPLLLSREPSLPAGQFPRWAVTVATVAIAEEVLLRGALFTALAEWRGPTMALVVTTVVFALMHVPVYGWHVFGVDLAAGLWLGALRLATRSVTAPAIAHAFADLAGWWLG